MQHKSIALLKRQLATPFAMGNRTALSFPLSTKIFKNTEISEMTRTELLFRLGDLLVNGLSDRHDFATEHFKAALALDESYEPAIAGLGQAEEAVGGREAASALRQ